MEYRVYTILYSSTAVFVTKSAHSLRSFALTARFARSTGLSALRAIEHYRGGVLNHGRTCQCCDRAIALKSMLSPNCTKQSSKVVGSPHTSLIYMIISHDWNFLIVSNVIFNCQHWNFSNADQRGLAQVRQLLSL